MWFWTSLTSKRRMEIIVLSSQCTSYDRREVVLSSPVDLVKRIRFREKFS